MKIYTRTGDDGSTGLLGGVRAGKDSPRIAAYGTVDELNATLGLARAALRPPQDAALDAVLARIQAELFELGAELATAPGAPAGAAAAARRVADADATRLEEEIDRFEESLAPLRSFILPGGSPAAAALHLCRTTCRRAEREAIALARAEPVRREVIVYLNRLSDHLFTLARAANRLAGIDDVPWKPRA